MLFYLKLKEKGMLISENAVVNNALIMVSI